MFIMYTLQLVRRRDNEQQSLVVAAKLHKLSSHHAMLDRSDVADSGLPAK